ncbi:hypothetical protein Tco_1539794 [Tanacetum coccineum]
MPHDSPIPRVHILGSDEGRMQPNELMELVTKLSDRVAVLENDLKQTKKTYGAAFTKLIKKVGDWDLPEYKDMAGSGGKMEPEPLVFHKMYTEEDSDRYIVQCFVNGLYASDGEINLKKNDNLISNDYAVKLCLENEVRKGKKLVKKELMVLLSGEIYFVQFIINPEEDEFEPGLIFGRSGRSFLRSTNAIVNFGEGQMLKEKKDPGAFIFPIRLEGRINENALADTGSNTNTMPYRIHEQLGRDDIMKEDRNIIMINYTIEFLQRFYAQAKLQCLYLHKVKECECLAENLSKQTKNVDKQEYNALLRSFAKLEQHSISLELALQQCQEQMKNDIVYKQDGSTIFLKEREQYFEIKDLKAQLQDKNISIKDKALNTKPSVQQSARLPNIANGNKPKPRNFNQQPRNWPPSMSSRVSHRTVNIAEPPRNQNPFLKSKELACPICKKCIYSANHDEYILIYLSKVKSHASIQKKDAQSHNTTKRYIPIEKKIDSKKHDRQIPIGQKFSPNKSSVVYLKTTPPRSGLTWKPTRRIFTYVGLKWIPIKKSIQTCYNTNDSASPLGKKTHNPNTTICANSSSLSVESVGNLASGEIIVSLKILSQTWKLDRRSQDLALGEIVNLKILIQTRKLGRSTMKLRSLLKYIGGCYTLLSVGVPCKSASSLAVAIGVLMESQPSIPCFFKSSKMAATAQNTNNSTIKYQKKLKFVEQPMAPAPDPETADQTLLTSTMSRLILNKRTKTMFEEQAKQELFETVKAFHACKQENGQLVSYILKRTKTKPKRTKLGTRLEEHEKSKAEGIFING